MKNIVEKYDYTPGSNGTFGGDPIQQKETGKDVTACTECLATRNAFVIRTDYDKYFMEVYNNKAQNFETDLLGLQFPNSIKPKQTVISPPSMTPQPSHYPSMTPQPSHYPSMTPRPSYYPSMTPQPSHYPSMTPRPSYYPSMTPRPSYYPHMNSIPM